MGFLDFLKKKQPATPPAPSSMPVAPSAPMSTSAALELPELPSFDSVAPDFNSSNNLPELPSFDDVKDMGAAKPASKMAPLPELPSFDAKAPEPLMVPPSLDSAPTESSAHEESNPQVEDVANDSETRYGPVFCDVDTYSSILTNMSHAKDEVSQLQSFAEHGHKLQVQSQAKYDHFHNTLSSMAKKLLLAEAKLFK